MPDLSQFKAEAVIGPPNTEQLARDLAEYGSEAIIRILRHGQDYALQVVTASGDGGDPLNDSKNCPGSPGCP